MSVQLLRMARIAGKRIELQKRDFEDGAWYRWAIWGRGEAGGSLWTQSYTPEDLWARAMRHVREEHPRARLRVTYCFECYTRGEGCRHEGQIPISINLF